MPGEDTIHVLQSGGDDTCDGSLACPVATLGAALDLSRGDASRRHIAVGPGSYAERLALAGGMPDYDDSGLVLEGCSPEEVVLEPGEPEGGAEEEGPVISIQLATDVRVAGMELRGGRRALLLATGGLVDVQGVRIAQSRRVGIVVDGVDAFATFADVEVEGTVAETTDSGAGIGYGVSVRLWFRTFRLLRPVLAAGGCVAGPILSSTWVYHAFLQNRPRFWPPTAMPRPRDGEKRETRVRGGTLEFRGGRVSGSQTAGIVYDATHPTKGGVLVLEGVTVEGTSPDPATGAFGRGVHVQEALRVEVEDVDLLDNADSGFFSFASLDVTLEDVRVSGVVAASLPGIGADCGTASLDCGQDGIVLSGLTDEAYPDPPEWYQNRVSGVSVDGAGRFGVAFEQVTAELIGFDAPADALYAVARNSGAVVTVSDAPAPEDLGALEVNRQFLDPQASPTEE